MQKCLPKQEDAEEVDLAVLTGLKRRFEVMPLPMARNPIAIMIMHFDMLTVQRRFLLAWRSVCETSDSDSE